MKIEVVGLRGGHSANCIGAVGLRNEYSCMQDLYKYVKAKLEKHGKKVVDCNSNHRDKREEVRQGANKANNAGCDIFISLHMNSFNGSANGTEAWIAENSRVSDVAKRLVNNFASLGLYNRGVKAKNTYWEMQDTKMPNIIFETLFCDNAHDINNVWSPTSYEKMAGLIANAIDPSIPIDETQVEPPKPQQKNYQVRIYSFTNKNDAENCKKKIDEIGWYCQVEEME